MEIEIAAAAEADGRVVLTVSGALDLASRDQLLVAGAEALNRDHAKALVLDLAQVSFIDSSGIGALVQLAGDAADVGRAFVIRNPSDRVRRILQITGLLDTWTIES